MTKYDAERGVAEVLAEDKAGDFERAHGLEDKLLWQFVRNAAEADFLDLRECAKAILRLDGRGMPRWTA